MASFVDRVTVHAAGGGGGDGCASVRRMKYKPLAGPDGGNGGRGGSVIVRVDPQTTTLLSFHYGPHVRATNGQPGIGGFGHGKNGEDVVLPVPLGTVVKDREGTVLADLSAVGESFVVARGGAGGLGNAALATRARKAPGFALLGEPGEERDVVLELKSVADVALVGFPSSGKSSLIAAMSAARPKIADYPFTTLVPNLGVVQAGDVRYTLADVPGLVRGASKGRGLGLDFLRHIERCSVVVHVIDTAAPQTDRDPVSDLRAIEAELRAYQEDLSPLEGYVPLARRPRVIALNKVDLPEGREMAQMMRPDLERFGWPIVEVSAVTHAGLRELSFTLARLVQRERAHRPTPRARPVLHPRPLGAASRVSATRREWQGATVYQVRGEKPERWVIQTDFANDEAVGYLADRLAAAGVEDRLREAGASPGDTVVIGDLPGGAVFDWEPAATSGAELLGARGTDLRLEAGRRPTREERRAEHHRRMDAKAQARRTLRRERESGQWTDPRP